MKLVQINTVCNGSVGKIMHDIQISAKENNIDAISFYGRRKGFKDTESIKFGNNVSFFFHVLLTMLFGYQGTHDKYYTKKMIKKLKEINPDIILLHNIHGYYLNYKMLFKYLKEEYHGKVFWTFHDCLPITGHCAYFDYVNCNKWQTMCHNCPQLKAYPPQLVDTSKNEYNLKKETFTNIPNLTLITPSKWLKDILDKSYLKDYPKYVINNGIDLNVFKYTYDENIYDKYNIPKNKKILLGVASVWEQRKGLDEFIKLSKDIYEDTIIVLVGLNKKQLKNLPSNVIGILRTDNQLDLVKIYSIADILINPTKEDNYPTVNIESIACKTPVIAYNTGGCKEQITNKTGVIVNSYQDLLKEIKLFLANDFKKYVFDNRDVINNIDAKIKYQEYINLFK